MDGDGPRRRRRSLDEPAQRGRLPLFPFFVVVVLAGLALGAFLSRHFNGAPPAAREVAGNLTTAAPRAGATRSPGLRSPPRTAPSAASMQTPSSRPSPSASGAATARPAPHRVALITPKPHLIVERPRGLPAATPQRSAQPVLTPAPPPTQRPVHTVQPSGSGSAEAVARDYLLALVRGDSRSANSALGKSPNSGTTFDEQSFIDRQSRITDLRTTNNGDGTYKVEAEVSSLKGTYFVTFHVARNDASYYITDHYAIKVQ